MKKYEYKIVVTKNAFETLNEYGSLGWRCIRIHHMSPMSLKLYLEREYYDEKMSGVGVDIRQAKDEE